MPIIPDYPCHCGYPWEDTLNCPDCGATCGVLVCSLCDGLVDACYNCNDDNSNPWDYDPEPEEDIFDAEQ